MYNYLSAIRDEHISTKQLKQYRMKESMMIWLDDLTFQEKRLRT